MTLSQSIRSLDFFENLSDEQIDVLSNFSFISKYEKDSILFYETDLKTNLLFLVSGLIKIYKYDLSNVENRKRFETDWAIYYGQLSKYADDLATSVESLLLPVDEEPKKLKRTNNKISPTNSRD